MDQPLAAEPRSATPTPLPDRVPDEVLDITVWRSGDVTDMGALITDSLEHLRPWMAWATHEPLDDARRLQMFNRWNRQRLRGHSARYATRHNGVLLGGSALHRSVGPGGLDIGYWLGAHATGQGYATRTAAALVRAAFDQPDIAFVQISHATTNTHSAAVAQRLGFTPISTTAEATHWRLDRPDPRQ